MIKILYFNYVNITIKLAILLLFANLQSCVKKKMTCFFLKQMATVKYNLLKLYYIKLFQ